MLYMVDNDGTGCPYFAAGFVFTKNSDAHLIMPLHGEYAFPNILE